MILAADAGLSMMLEKSLRRARERAVADLDPDLFEALDWPADLGEYEQYLRRFLAWIPQESGARAWKKQAGGTSSSREISDRLAHFFWLIDQNDDGGEAIGESAIAFREWCTTYAREWGHFLDSPESFSQDILDSFITNSPEFTVGESLVGGRPNAPSGWLSFNQFFARELNPGLRPISAPASNLVVTSPADCTFQHSYGIGDRSEIPATTIKGTHTYGTIDQLLRGSRYADSFAGGTFAHYMLPPWAYHRFHIPVSGRVEESFVVQGTVVMEVDLIEHELVSSDATTTGFEFSQTRGIVIVDTTDSPAGDIGIVAVVPVGMAHVGSVVLTAEEGTPMSKGDEFGYFQFGGSDIIMLLQADVDAQVDTDPTPRHVGSPAIRCRSLNP
ncbi:phosphatidylserine decarboxylase [Antrihabitans cavernicola]|uniref:Phosphatidylserine decarboxylase n=2 Tax=Antrihabitans cavernicola TaxID=2495913 RepID=A0A5A7S198_9NOCA|nr:phosphatidylserine decarboxylase [Spelaeibacter cavernicola]